MQALHNFTTRGARSTFARGFVLALLALSLLWQQPALAQDTAPVLPAEVTATWLEPRGVNIIDLVGLVPDSHLAGGIISYETSTGMYIYNSGTRSGNTVTINATIIPRYFTFGANTYTQIGCISQFGTWDQWISTAPATQLTLFSGGRNITNQITNLGAVAAGQILPTGNSSDYMRYPLPNPAQVAGANPFNVPANNGCKLVLNGNFNNLTATIRATVPQQINIVPMGSQTFNTHSYIGPGSAGIFQSLNDQMSRKYGSRHDKFSLTIPADADYVLVKFAPTPVDPYASVGNPANAGLPGSGSYRLNGERMSVDHVSMIGLPLGGQWGDSDQAGGSEYLPYIPFPTGLASPELFLPPGFAFNPCMTSGGCPDALLSDLFSFTYPTTVYYYQFTRLPGSTLQRIPLRSVGSDWNGAAVVTQAEFSLFTAAETDEILQSGRRILLPMVSSPTVVKPPTDDPTGCPCGWFDGQGRMFDFIPAP